MKKMNLWPLLFAGIFLLKANTAFSIHILWGDGDKGLWPIWVNISMTGRMLLIIPDNTQAVGFMKKPQ